MTDFRVPRFVPGDALEASFTFLANAAQGVCEPGRVIRPLDVAIHLGAEEAARDWMIGIAGATAGPASANGEAHRPPVGATLGAAAGAATRWGGGKGVWLGGECIGPSALDMAKDQHEAGDGGWRTEYPTPDKALGFGEERAYNSDATDCVIFSFGNGVPMSLRAARAIEKQHGWKVRVVDLRWLVPLNEAAIAKHAAECKRILVVDEGRHSAGVGEGVITAITEAGHGAKPLKRIVGADTFTPPAGAAFLVIPSEVEIIPAYTALSGLGFW